MIVYFLRHASAGKPKTDPAKDEKRALDDDGIGQSRDIGRLLAALETQVDVILSSPLKRASQTASLVGNEMNHEGKLELSPALRPEADINDFRQLLERQAKREAIMVVGHNPNLSEFLGLLISERGCEAAIDLKKGAVAKVDVGHGVGVLHWVVTPKLVRAAYDSSATSSRPKTSRK